MMLGSQAPKPRFVKCIPVFERQNVAVIDVPVAIDRLVCYRMFLWLELYN